jgi:phage gp29-like protein
MPQVDPKELKKYSPAGAQINPQWVTSAMRASRLGQIHRQADIGDIRLLMAMLQEILTKNTTINGLMQVRVAGLESVRFEFVPNEADKNVKRASDFAALANNVMDNIKLVRKTSDGYTNEGDNKQISKRVSTLSSWLGFFAGWIYYDYKDNLLLPVALEGIDNRSFVVDNKDDSLVFMTDTNNGIPFKSIGPFNSIEVRHNGISNRLAEISIGRPISYSWFLDFNAYILLLRFLEMTASPSPILERANKQELGESYNTANDDEAIEFIRNWVAGNMAAVPSGFSLKWQEPGKGGHSIFEAVRKFVIEDYKYGILGQLSSTNETGNLGGKSGIGLEIQDFITTSEAYKVASMYSEMINRTIKLNYPNDLPPKIIITRDNPAKRDSALATIKSAKDLGIPVIESYALQVAGLPAPKEGDRLLGGSVYTLEPANPGKPTNEAKKPTSEPANTDETTDPSKSTEVEVEIEVDASEEPKDE